MQTSTIFDYKLCQFHCNDNLFRTPELLASVEDIFKNQELDTSLNGHLIGQGISTFGNSTQDLLKTNGITPLIEWIKVQILNAAEFLGHHGVQSVDLYQAFTNKLYPGCSGKVHNHTASGHGVVVFYFQQPQFGSELVLVKDGFIGADLENFKDQDKHHLKVKQGDLIIHETRTWHGVTVNNGSTPRIVFVFEYRYIK